MINTLKTIAYIKTDFPSKFGIPRQSGLVNKLRARIIFTPEYRNSEALRGLDGYSHLWLIWGFSQIDSDAEWRPTVRPPRLGGNRRMGVFATRSPYRPNPLGLSSVAIEKIDFDCAEAPVITVCGADCADNTPIYDIKPYLPITDCHPDASGGFSDEKSGYGLKVSVQPDVISVIPEDKREALIELLSQDPRPAYQNSPERVYGFVYAGYEVKFTVNGDTVMIISAERK